jgi:hypothetical protein
MSARQKAGEAIIQAAAERSYELRIAIYSSSAGDPLNPFPF